MAHGVVGGGVAAATGYRHDACYEGALVFFWGVVVFYEGGHGPTGTVRFVKRIGGASDWYE
jgi:hypothetical protein